MVARRTLTFLAAALVAALVAGCAQTVSGRGTYAGGPIGTVPSGSSSPTETPSESAGPTATASSPSSSSSGDASNQVCAALDRGATEQLFGASVTLKKSQSSGCQISASNGKSMIVAVFDYLTLSEYKKGTYKDIKVDGHPAVNTDSNIIYVARSMKPDDDGLLAAYFSGLDTDGTRIASSVLSQLLTTFSR